MVSDAGGRRRGLTADERTSRLATGGRDRRELAFDFHERERGVGGHLAAHASAADERLGPARRGPLPPPLPIAASHTLPTPFGLFASPTPGYGHTKIPHPLSAAKDKQVSGAPDAYCASPNDSAPMGLSSSLPAASSPALERVMADTTSSSTEQTAPIVIKFTVPWTLN